MQVERVQMIGQGGAKKVIEKHEAGDSDSIILIISKDQRQEGTSALCLPDPILTFGWMFHPVSLQNRLI